ncbi:lipase family protein [Paenibacillus sp. QZ-Y1]|uniref:lipase family protein n=1 Tax=Paenibacillus sp. QZ-Y1 TaxID=3414511 RepID=UPI003F78DAC6
MDTYITDKTYKEISELAYLNLNEGDYPDTLDSANWKVIEPDEAKLHRKSGFDAVVLKNDLTDQIVIGYRGTEPEGKATDVLADWETDAFDVVGGRTRRLEDAVTDPERHNIFKNSPFKLMMDNSSWENNQFHQAEELFEVVQKAYPDSDISLTGHSLGGGLAQYVAARH